MGWHRTESAWRWLENDPELRSVILTRIRELEEARVKESEEILEEERRPRKALQKAAWLVKKKEIAGRMLARKKVLSIPRRDVLTTN